ncbi:molybdenum cofactor guanylyltransferase [Myceligenerans pegani]|uniref:NTP transferase domain-containing protein n=1 Tax=Myceligenerans pegani TaxID=2776917 RepID=A0ABR9MZY1_9MICO|nr:NTP transferase domain-containing protein [Myceligenerans sp. TRM 65318]MBE1876959.1 NTP transferase domain-containing protein [Myceligenerans sp. TRM 65318]MBE3019230.1 NTP transferase domain-containing protein [Myceligenerans sp. TRM 65318]
MNDTKDPRDASAERPATKDGATSAAIAESDALADRPAPGSGSALGPYDAIVLAGGRASRLGGVAKPGLLSDDGVPLLHLALDAAGDARRIAVVGPDDLADAVAAHPAAPRTMLTREDPPYGGPVAGIAAGLAALMPPAAAEVPPTSAPRVVGGFPRGRSSDRRTTRKPPDHTEPDRPLPLPAGDRAAPGSPWVLVLAVDVPRVGAAVPKLRRAVRSDSGLDGAHLVAGGRAQWLVGLYRTDALAERLTAVGHDTPSGRGASVRRLLNGLRLLEVPDPGNLSADVDTWDDAEHLGVRPGPPPKERP